MWVIQNEGFRWRIAVAGHKLLTPLPEGGQWQGRHSPSPAVGECT